MGRVLLVSLGVPPNDVRGRDVRSQPIAALVALSCLASPCHAHFEPGEGPNAIGVEVRLWTVRAHNQAAKDEIELDDSSGPGVGEILTLIHIARPAPHIPNQIKATRTSILGVNTYSTNFVPAVRMYDLEIPGPHPECEPLAALSMSFRAIEDDTEAWQTIIEAADAVTGVVAIFYTVTPALAASISAAAAATFVWQVVGTPGDESLGERTVVYDAQSPPPEGLVTVSTLDTPGINGAAIDYDYSVAVTHLGPHPSCQIAPPPVAANLSVDPCYRERAQSIYSTLSRGLGDLASIDNEPGIPDPLTATDLASLREQVRTHVWYLADELTEGLVNSLTAFPSVRAHAQQELDLARATQPINKDLAIAHYALAAEIALHALSSGRTCGGGEPDRRLLNLLVVPAKRH